MSNKTITSLLFSISVCLWLLYVGDHIGILFPLIFSGAFIISKLKEKR